MTDHQMRCHPKRRKYRKSGTVFARNDWTTQPTVGQGARHGDHRDPLHGVRCRNEARPGFVFKMPSPEMEHIEEGFGLFAGRCRTRHSDSIRCGVRRPDA